MYSLTKAFSFVLVAAAIGVQAETHTVHFTNKYALPDVEMLIQETNLRLAVALELLVSLPQIQNKRLILLYSRR